MPTAIDAVSRQPRAPAQRRQTPPTASVRAGARLLGVVALVGVAVAALHARVPPPAPASPRTGGGSAVVVLVALLAVSVAVLSLALLARARARPQPRASSEREPRRWPGRAWRRSDLVWIASAAVVLTGVLLLPVAGRMVEGPPPTVRPPTSQNADRPAQSQSLRPSRRQFRPG